LDLSWDGRGEPKLNAWDMALFAVQLLAAGILNAACMTT
jgi:hypothetical protein